MLLLRLSAAASHSMKEFFSQPGPAEISLCVFLFFLLIHLTWLLFFYLRTALHKNVPAELNEFPPVSVVICSRSEASKLVEHLPFIFNQDYPDFEVVVVNDRSWDDTKEILKAFQVKYSNLKVITIEESNHDHKGKKMALTIGIKGANNEVLLMTDADCKPLSRNWIREMVKGYGKDKKMVLGFSPYKREKSFLNKLIRFDTFLAAINYFSFAKAGIPYMGVGRNLSYKKQLYFDNSGFKNHYHISSGDDDLFVNEAATSKNVSVVITRDAFTESLPKTTFKDWFRQKKRHFTTAPYYRLKHKLLLGLWPLGFFVMLATSVILFVLNKYLLIILAGWFLRLLLQMVIFSLSMKRLGEKDLLWMSPFLEVLFFFLHPVIFFSNKFVKADKWN